MTAQAALVDVTRGAGSGAGPHTYLLNRGTGSSRDPREMMMPIGSFSSDLIRATDVPL